MTTSLLLSVFFTLTAVPSALAQSCPAPYEYIIVGAGPGGGPLAARLALAGHKTLLIDAGDDEGALEDYQVPLLYSWAPENPAMNWNYFVRQYDDDAMAKASEKSVYAFPNGTQYIGTDPPEGAEYLGVWYPRAATLGGCAAHNALITVTPQDDDWTFVQNLTGDASWSPANMRTYFEKLEHNSYLPANTSGHGYSGWLYTEQPPLSVPFSDSKILAMTYAAAQTLGSAVVGPIVNTIAGLTSLLQNQGDMNRDTPDRDSKLGMFQIPIHTHQGVRNTPREFVLNTMASGAPLDFLPNSLVTKVLFDNSSGTPVATGVEYMRGQSVYQADPRYNGSTVQTAVVHATREVILSAGAFNTPQLLKLSGVGPRAELESLNISVVVDLPGVGTNLQDRLESTVVLNTTTDFTEFADCTFAYPGIPDACYNQWQENRTDFGAYGTNGIPFGITMKSSTVAQDSEFPNDNDLIVYGGPTYFRGYYPAYTNAINLHSWTWAVLKAHIRNRAGTVNLTSSDPTVPPSIHFHYLSSGTGGPATASLDSLAVQEALTFARSINSNFMIATNGTATEVIPGPAITSADGSLAEFVDTQGWGHHASCSCPIGADGDEMAVLDSKFRVRGTKGLRVVDASAFPRIPGFFITVPILMISEKAADVILEAL